MIGFHKSDKKPYVFFATPSKLKRIIMTIFVQLMYVKYGNILYALDRYGSHDEENFIGIIRMLCDGDNTYERITHNLARYEYKSHESDATFIKPRPNRLNMGGVQLTEGGFNIDFEFTPKSLADALLTIPFKNSGKDIADVQRIIIEFIDKLEIIAEQAPYKKFNIPAKSSNATILNLLITFGISKSSTIKPKEFTSLEVQMIDDLLLRRQQINLNNLAQCHACDISVIQKFIDLRIQILSKRAWLPVEDNYIIFLLQGIFTIQEIEIFFTCRIKDDIDSRKRYLKNRFIIPKYVKGTKPTIYFNDPLSQTHFNQFLQSYFGNKK